MDSKVLDEVRDLIEGRLIINPPSKEDQWDLEKLAGITDTTIATEPQIFQNSKAQEASLNNLVLITWNIAYGDKFDQILASLKRFDQEYSISAIALQEVAKNSSITNYKDVAYELAEALGYSAVYGAMMTHLDKNKKPLIHDEKPCVLGNAVLTRLPLEEKIRIIRLPPQYDFYNHPIRNDWGNRIALEVIQNYKDDKIKIISAHPEDKTYSHRRAKQTEHIIKENKNSNIKDIFICGDFNTFWSGLERTDRIFKKAGYTPVNKNTSTIKFKLPLRLDNIYAKTRMQLYKSGVDKNAQGSDHYPVWAVFK